MSAGRVTGLYMRALMYMVCAFVALWSTGIGAAIEHGQMALPGLECGAGLPPVLGGYCSGARQETAENLRRPRGRREVPRVCPRARRGHTLLGRCIHWGLPGLPDGSGGCWQARSTASGYDPGEVARQAKNSSRRAGSLEERRQSAKHTRQQRGNSAAGRWGHGGSADGCWWVRALL